MFSNRFIHIFLLGGGGGGIETHAVSLINMSFIA